MDSDKTGFIGISEIEETLVSFGFVQQKEDVVKLVAQFCLSKNKTGSNCPDKNYNYRTGSVISDDGETILNQGFSERQGEIKIGFEQFLQILKEAQVQNPKGINGNYLNDKNVFFEDV